MHAESSRFSKAFTMAVSWNALFYIVYKLSFVALTFFVYKKLSPEAFSVWAATNSIIFLLLLWLNCGLKQSIPRFAPLFSQDKKLFRSFISGLLVFKITTLLVSIPLLHLCLERFVPNSTLSLALTTALFMSEGIVSLIQLIYHAHFWQKQFNLIQTFFLLFEMARNFTLLYKNDFSQDTFVTDLFVSKLLGNCGAILFALFFMPLLYRSHNLKVVIDKALSVPLLIRSFLQHSLFMWITALIQSLSERNFLFPCVRFVQGDATAGVFKVVHDAAIFFQRISIKTIGIADTALLSHIELDSDRRKRTHFTAAFSAIFKTMFALCIPLGCLGGLFFLKQQLPTLGSSALLLFIVITIGSLLEIIISPYTRVLEVKLEYKLLALSYLPYLIGTVLCLYLYSHHFLSLITFIALLHCSRLLCAGLMVYYTTKHYHMTLPLRFIILTLIASSSLTVVAWVLW